MTGSTGSRTGTGPEARGRSLEHHRSPLLPRPQFYRRVLGFAAFAAVLVAGSLAIGTLGYHFVVDLAWIDSLHNAAMILTGMGPVSPITTRSGKLFASAYALFSGVAFLSIVAVLWAPMVHRFLHRLHLESDDQGERDDD